MGLFDDYLGGAQTAAPPGAPRITVTPGSVEEPSTQQQPRGIRNNNPGNIEDGPFARSIPGYAGTDGRFAKYDSPEGGQAALEGLLQSYGRRGFNTPAAIVGRYAPATDGNPVGNYARYIAEGVGSNLTDQLDLNNPEVRRTVAQRIVEFENGKRSGARPPATEFSAQSRQPSAPAAGIFGDYLAPQGQVAAPPVSGTPPSAAGGEPAQPAPVQGNTEGLSGRVAREGMSPAAPTAGEAALGGFAKSATFNFLDELKGLAAAGGLDPNNPDELAAAIALIKGGYRKATGAPGADEAYRVGVSQARGQEADQQQFQPGATLAGQVGGAVATLPVGGAGARGLTLGERAVQGARGGAVIGGISGVGEGTDAASRAAGGIVGAGTGAAIGAAAPAVIEGAVKAGRAVATPIANAVRGIRDPESEAARRVTLALERDIKADPSASTRLTPQEFAASVQSGGPAKIMDIGGETTRALARSASNTSPEGRQLLNNTINDRFEGQTGRVTKWLDDTFNYPNVHAQQQAIEQTAKAVNRPAYAKAYQEGDRPIWSPELQRLVGSPDVVDAMRNAAEKGKSRAIVNGFGGFNSSVQISPSGVVEFTKGKNGVPTYPNLQFWDYAKRALDDKANSLARAGNNSEAGVVKQLAAQLRGELDNQVPSFAQARAGAAHFFGAENALEAGQNFVMQNFQNSAVRQQLGKMTPSERQLFQDGFVSRFMETLNKVGDRRSILNQIGDNPAAREKLQIVLGPAKTSQLEAGMRAEGVMDLARKAVQGNSTTARQLAELGLAGGTYGLGTGGDVLNPNPTAVMNAVLVYGAARGRTKINEGLSRKVAEMLTSNDPALLLKGIKIVSKNEALLTSMRRADAALARSGAQQAPGVPALQSMGAGRADEQQQQVPRPPGQ